MTHSGVHFLLGMLKTLLGLGATISVVILMVRSLPGDPAALILGEQAVAADLAKLRASLGLEGSILEQFVRVWQGILRGDFGQSIARGRPVAEVLVEAIPYTVLLALLAAAISGIGSLWLGMAAARRRGVADAAVLSAATLGLAIPNFWLGPMLILVFAVSLGWVPTSFDGSALGWVLPVVTLGLSLMAFLTRIVRATAIEQLGQPYVRTARAKGLDESSLAYRHALPNVLIPFATVLGLQVGALLAGSVVTEAVFSVPGIGKVFVQAINQRDYPVVEACAIWIACLFFVLNRAVDAINYWVDPRIRRDKAL